MSTRSQTLFIVRSKYLDDNKKPFTHENKALIYRHSDGYPEGMVPDLLEFLAWNDGRNEDCEYMAANWIFWYKRKHEESMVEDKFGLYKGYKWTDPGGNNWVKLGMGVCEPGQYHGDIEYFYKVIVEDDCTKDKSSQTITIEVYDPDTRGDETKIPEKPFATVKVDPKSYKATSIQGLTKKFKQKEEDEE